MLKSNVVVAEAELSGASLPSGKWWVDTLAPLHRPVLITFAVFVAYVSASYFLNSVDYVGNDNDDVLRLVQVRDLLSGQGWFDLTQLRLGLEGGTLMHWSRLIDLPIANLIMLFSLFLDPQRAEAAALFVWPVLTALPVFYAMALAGNAMGGPSARMHALLLSLIFVVSINRFQPGSIDHHNVQLGLIALIAACLVQPGFPARAFSLAGVAAALAIAIGAETTPHIAIVCLIVALQWLWLGEPVKNAVLAFTLAMAAVLTGAFFLTVPPWQYSLVVCDGFSTGFYSLGVFGAGLLFLAAATTSHKGLAARFAALGVVGTATFALVMVIAPGCLGNPLSNLDPLLQTMWLATVSEAQSLLDKLGYAPSAVAGFYAVPLLAMALCLWRIRQGHQARSYATLFALILVSWIIGAIQVRGAVFSNLLSVIPLSALLADLQMRARANPQDHGKGLIFAGMYLAALPIVWALSGALVAMGIDKVKGEPVASLLSEETTASCIDADAMAPLAKEPTGVVSGPSDLGAYILRYTHHRALSAPYHRNQGGMLTELYAAMAKPKDAVKFLNGANVTLVAFCGSNPQVANVISAAPDGLYAELAKGHVPAWLEPVPQTQKSALQLYRVLPNPIDKKS